jgi:hypothetical protein
MNKLSASGLKLGLIIFLASPLGATAVAQQVDFNFLEARFVNDSAGRGINANSGNGLEIAGSYQIGSDWLAFGSYRSQDYGAADYTNIEIGGGLFLRGFIDHDFLAKVSLVKREFSYDHAGSYSDTGVRVSLGVRDFFFQKYLSDIEVLQPLELRGSINVENVGDFDAYLELGADYHFHPSFSAGLQLELGGDVQAVSIGGRWYF